MSKFGNFEKTRKSYIINIAFSQYDIKFQVKYVFNGEALEKITPQEKKQ